MPPHHNASCVVIINNHIYHVKSIKPRLSKKVLFEGPDHILIKTNLIRARIHKTGDCEGTIAPNPTPTHLLLNTWLSNFYFIFYNNFVAIRCMWNEGMKYTRKNSKGFEEPMDNLVIPTKKKKKVLKFHPFFVLFFMYYDV